MASRESWLPLLHVRSIHVSPPHVSLAGLRGVHAAQNVPIGWKKLHFSVLDAYGVVAYLVLPASSAVHV